MYTFYMITCIYTYFKQLKLHNGREYGVESGKSYMFKHIYIYIYTYTYIYIYIYSDDNEWICGICGYLNTEDGTDLVLCDGPCKGSYHMGCLDAKSKKVRITYVCVYFYIDKYLKINRCICVYKSRLKS
jgi:hypothetical protein